MNIKNDNIVNIEYSSLKNSSELLMSNLMNRSIFGNKNLIIVRNVTSILKTEIISLLDLNNSTNTRGKAPPILSISIYIIIIVYSALILFIY